MLMTVLSHVSFLSVNVNTERGVIHLSCLSNGLELGLIFAVLMALEEQR